MIPSEKFDPANRLRRNNLNNPELLDEEMIRKVVDHFYALAREDEIVGPVFKRVIPDEAWRAHLDLIADFWSSMLLGSGRYNGRPLPKHIALPELSDAHFKRWLALFRNTVLEICPAEIADLFIDRSERIANSFRINIAMRRGENTIHMKPLEREQLL